jgi:hypothetical protein
VIENAGQFTTVIDTLGQQFELAPGKHAHADLEIGENLTCPDLELHHGFQLVQASMALNGVVHVFMKTINRVIGGRDPLPEGHLSQGIHNSGNIDTIGALTRAGIASNAHPYGFAGQGFTPFPQLNQADDLIGQQVHVRGKRAATAAGQTMPAQLNGLSSEVIDNLDEIVIIHIVGDLPDIMGFMGSCCHLLLRCLF